MSKMGSHDPFGHLKHKLWPKERLGVKLGIDLIYLCAGDVRHVVGKLSTRATNFFQTSSRSEVCTQSYSPTKLRESRFWQFRDSHLGTPRTKSHLDVGLVERHRVYYKGGGGGFPQVQAMMSLVSPSCPRLVLAPKVFQLCINHFVLVLCRSV
jgi:hypothetical protein